MSNNPNQPQIDDAVLSGQSLPQTSPSQCPICQTKYIEGEGEVNHCSVCNWDLTPCPEALVEKHNAQLAWAKEIWRNFHAQENQLQVSQSLVEEVKQEKARFEGAVLHRLEKLEQMRDSYEAVISDHELEQQLSKMKEQLKEAEQDRQKLRHQIEQLSSHVEILKAEQPQKIANTNLPLISGFGIDYSRLRSFLIAAQWKKANDETIVIIETILSQLIESSYSNREIIESSYSVREISMQLQGNDFFISSETYSPTHKSEFLNQFPCEDIYIIDQLWSNYSYGRFGFSLQKQLYELCHRNYSTFTQIVGWVREDQERYTYSNEEKSFDIKAPRGHLPILNTFVVDPFEQKMLGYQFFLFLVQRLSTCNGDELTAEYWDSGELDEELDNSME
jgi:uncharacterized Zn finger protein (UPF0148 family)